MGILKTPISLLKRPATPDTTGMWFVGSSDQAFTVAWRHIQVRCLGCKGVVVFEAFTLGENRFTGLTDEEYEASLLGGRGADQAMFSADSMATPCSFDLRIPETVLVTANWVLPATNFLSIFCVRRSAAQKFCVKNFLEQLNKVLEPCCKSS